VTRLTSGSHVSLCASLGGLGALAWLAALVLPAVALPSGETISGARVLLEGWRAVSLGVPSWCANPAFGIALVLGMMQRHRAAAVASGLSLAFATTSFVAPWLAALGGVRLPEFEFASGFAVWITALALVCAGACCGFVAARRGPGATPRD